MNPYETTLNPGNIHRLRQAWSFRLGSALTDEPLFAAGVRVRVPHTHLSVPENLVIAGSEDGRLAAVNARTGKKVWERNLGSISVPSCGDLPHYGVTGTPAIDRRHNNVYAADGTGRVDQVDLSTGKIKHRWTLTHDPSHEHVYSALTFLKGIVYAEIASICDVQPFHGQVIAINVRRGSLRRWFATGSASGGGIWGSAGAAADPARNALYVGTGTSFLPTDHIVYAEHVVRLTLGLQVVASNYPGLPTGDADFGTTPVLYQVPGCPRQLAIGNKYGGLFVYDRASIGRGPVQRIQLGGSVKGAYALIAPPAYLPSQRTVYITNPRRSGSYRAGMLAFKVNRHCRLSLRWQAPGPGPQGTSPSIAGGIVFYGSGFGNSVIAIDARTGKRLWESARRTIRGAVNNGVSVVNGAVYAGSWDGRIHAFRLK